MRDRVDFANGSTGRIALECVQMSALGIYAGATKRNRRHAGTG